MAKPSPRNVALLTILHLAPGATVVALVDKLAPFYPPHAPPSQQTVRNLLNALIEARLVTLGHTGKPRTYFRTPQSYRLLPATARGGASISSKR